jgi:hypothetical protein
MSALPVMPRVRRRRRLSAALRWAEAREPAKPPAELDTLRERLTEIADRQPHPGPGTPNLAEQLARLDHGGVMPAEIIVTLTALLQTLLAAPASLPPSTARSNDR